MVVWWGGSVLSFWILQLLLMKLWALGEAGWFLELWVCAFVASVPIFM